ncbi:hypothetical protein PYW07_012125 [Mythimna separata]|uniref:Uncharacterized protein n=1 Tax=Mythimna separata TaxID=271217 RepID=A0AAD7YKL7_MYTSE|nr:hypothetical protein PYW07_012125 [Mythimna separata]
MWCTKCVPKTFLGRFSLRDGALFVGALMLVIGIICVICIAVEIVYYKECEGCTAIVIHNVYGFSISSIFYSIFMIVVNAWFIWGVKNAISIICVITLAIEIIYYRDCEGCTTLVMHNVYSFSINAFIYCICMIFVNVWFIWGVTAKKSSVVLSWVVIMVMWWAQALVLVSVLMGIYISNYNVAWIIAFACAIVAFMIFFYCILVGYGYWLQIRKITIHPPNEASILRD